MYTEQEVAADIRRRVKLADKTLSDLCRESGIAKTTFHKMANGETSPRLSTLRRIEKVLSDWSV